MQHRATSRTTAPMARSTLAVHLTLAILLRAATAEGCSLLFSAAGCSTPAGMCRDPLFISGEAVTFYFDGRKDGDFCLLSDSSLHINARFITWRIQSITVLFDNHRLYIGMVDRLMIAFDGVPLYLERREGAKWEHYGVSVVRTSSADGAVVEVEGRFKITAVARPQLELGFKFYSLSNDVDGIMGQAYREDFASALAQAGTVKGGECRFASSGPYAADCRASRFRGVGSERADVTFGAAWAAVGSSAGGRGACVHTCLLL